MALAQCNIYLAKAIATFPFIPPAKAAGNGISIRTQHVYSKGILSKKRLFGNSEQPLKRDVDTKKNSLKTNFQAVLIYL